MAILFSNYSPKIRKVGILIPKFKDFYFAPTFAIDFENGNSFFSNSSQKYSNTIFFFFWKLKSFFFLRATLNELILFSKT